MYRLLFPLLMLMLAACAGKPEPEVAPVRLVIEGYMDSGGYPDVLVNMSMVPSDEEGSVVESVVKWGFVTLSDGESEVVLTGGVDYDYFPPYHYYSYQMKGEPGKTYTLTANYHGMTATSTVTMPYPTPIDRVEMAPVAGCDTVRHITVHFKAPADCPAYYHLSAQVIGEDGHPYPCMLGAHEVVHPGEEVSLPVYRGNSNRQTGSYTSDMPVGRKVVVRLSRVTRDVFLFWRAYDNASLVAGSVFVGAPGSLASNVADGYGVWSAQGTSAALVDVQ